jgi:hypothetical protein
VLGYDRNVLTESIFVKLLNKLSYCCQPFHCPTTVGRLALDWEVDYTDANQRIIAECLNTWVQYMECDFDNTFQCRVPSFPVLNFSWTTPNQIFQFQVCLPARNTISTISNRCKNSQQLILHPQVQEYAVVVPTKYKQPHGWVHCVDGFIRVVKAYAHVWPRRKEYQ